MKIENPHKVENGCKVAQHPDPRVQRTRKLLEDSFSALMTQKSFSALSVQDIADHATVNRATFYAHYTSKQDIATKVIRHNLRRTLLQCFDERPALTAENLVQIAVALFDFLKTMHGNCPESATELAGTVGPTLQTELYDIMEHWVTTENAYLRLFPGCSKATVATVLSWSLYGGALRWVHSSPRQPAAQVCQEIVAILLPSPK